ncbi:DUF2264 domain-containing protein [Streptomyces sp. NPDC058653]|uniref:DUF2264 domain-containing protein n=1 Tax=Streptomyces sp. NPDC058653 TaxID=3346576 RepID=UPI00366516E0
MSDSPPVSSPSFNSPSFTAGASRSRSRLVLPPDDTALSPYTGWTRAHWESVADQLLDALVPYASPGRALYRLPGRTSSSGELSDGLEGYARSFLLAAFRIAGARGQVDEALIERYAAGLAAGTDPSSGEAWPPLADRTQPMVEAASIAIGLHETRPWIWDRLDTRVQERVAEWLGGFIGRRTHDNNWRLFQVVSEQFLASVGAPHSRSDIENGLDRIEDWYVGGGWYTDGDGRKFDYYAGWAMHLYPLLWSRIVAGTRGPGGEPGDDGGRTEVYRERLARFLTTYPHFFGADGAPVHQGRSLTYRFAAATPVWMGALAGRTPLAPGLTRRLASGAVRHFVERGAPDERGLLTLGWYDAFLPVTQLYSGPASPYWASKAFVGLLLPADHAVWTEPERPLPVEESDRYTALPAPGWLLHGTRRDGIVRLVNHGSDRQDPRSWGQEPGDDDPHYAAFGYSTATAPDSAEEAWADRLGNHLALLAADGTPSRRRRIHFERCEGRTASSWYEAELPGEEGTFRIGTTSVLHGAWEIRVHRVAAPAGCPVREGGHAVAGPEVPVASTGPGWALARTAAGLTSALVGLHGWDPEPAGTVVRRVGANAYGTHSATPSLRLASHPGGVHVLVTLVALVGDATAAPDPEALRDAVRVQVDGEGVWLAFDDGESVQV